MAIRIKKNFNFKKSLEGARSNSSRRIKNAIVEEILSDYNRGISPVAGTNSYKPYRPSTAKKKGRKKPVTLNNTGKLHASLKAVQKGKKTINISFTGSRNQQISAYHQFGTTYMDARPMLPTRGMKFKKRIVDMFNKIISKELAKAFK